MNTSLISYINTKKLKLAREKADRDILLRVLNQKPPAKWVKKRYDGIEYIPIEIIENTLTQLFQTWRVDVKETKLILNSITATVRVWYRDPITSEMYYQDGVGAVPVQTDKGTILSIETIKPNALQIGLPMAKSYAIKDAVEHIGKLFGRDIGRKSELDFVPRYINEDGSIRGTENDRVKEFISQSKTREELQKIEEYLISESIYTSEYKSMIDNKRNTLA